jgi:hypothetical protein
MCFFDVTKNYNLSHIQVLSRLNMFTVQLTLGRLPHDGVIRSSIRQISKTISGAQADLRPRGRPKGNGSAGKVIDPKYTKRVFDADDPIAAFKAGLATYRATS